MIKSFSPTTIETISYYVYLLIDPRNDKVFYIGKGVGNRVFNHIYEAEASESTTDKLDTIRSIHSEGLEVKHYIFRFGLTEDQAFLVESALIDFNKLIKNNLSNIQSGHHSGFYTAEEIEAEYGASVLPAEELVDPLLVVNINRSYKPNSEDSPSIYECSRGGWNINMNRIKRIKYVVAEYRGIIRGIFAVESWSEKDEANKSWYTGYQITEKNNPEVYNRYMYKKVRQTVSAQQNPIQYINC